MVSRLKPLDLNRLETGSVRHQRYLLTHEQLGAPSEPGSSVRDLLRNLPRTGQAEQIRRGAALLSETVLRMVQDGALKLPGPCRGAPHEDIGLHGRPIIGESRSASFSKGVERGQLMPFPSSRDAGRRQDAG